MTLSLITDRRKEDVEYLLSLIAKGYGGMTGAEQTAWANTSLKGAYNYTDLNRVESAVAYLLPIFASAGYNITTTTKTNWAVNNDMTVAEATRYLYNIAQIRQAFTYFTTTPPAPTTLVGLNYERANHIEKILLDAENLIFKLLGSFFYSGDLYCGDTIHPGSLLKMDAYSWSEIADLAALGLAQTMFPLGSTKQYNVNSYGGKRTAYVMGYNHDTLASDGVTKASLTMGSLHFPSDVYLSMNPTSTNVGGWETCAIRTNETNNVDYFLNYFDLATVVQPVLKPTSNGAGAIVNTVDKFFLLSAREILGSEYYSLAGEGEQYARFAESSTERIKKLTDGTGIARNWWTRSADIRDNKSFIMVNTSGNLSSDWAEFGVKCHAIGFCI